MASLRESLQSRLGRSAWVGFVVGATLLLIVSVWRNLGDNEAAAASRDRVFICAASGESFTHELERGQVTPVLSPHSGEHTGYPAELCYWTPDGNVKDEPTTVLLNEYAGKAGPTFCRECNRLVVGHNPQPEPGDKPPPLKDHYKPSKKDVRDDR